jgi:hypothetical protein
MFMKRLIILASLVLAFGLFLGTAEALGQATFKMSFKFEAGGKKFPAGDYLVAQKEEGKIALLRVATGEETSIPILGKLPQPDTPVEAPQLIFDMVANFEPSYTEYVTDYLLAEVWLTGKEGSLVLAGERSEYTQSVKGGEGKK